MMSLWRGSFKDALELSKETVKRFWVGLFLTFAFNFLLNFNVEGTFAAPQAEFDDRVRIFSQLFLVLWSLAEGFLLFMFTAKPEVRPDLMLYQRPVQAHWGKSIWLSLTAESLRALGFIILWTLCLVIPGLIAYVLYALVMHVVLFSKEYDAGEVDALKLSTTLAKRMFLPFAALCIFLSISISGVGMLPQMYPVFSYTPLRIVCELIAFLITLYGYSLMRILFHKSMIRHLSK